MTDSPAPARASRLLIVLAFLAVYLIWGSTYLAIRFVVVSIPPFLMAGVRFALAGAILYVWRMSRGETRPTARQWRSGAISGTLMLLGGTGLVCWVEQWVPSGLTALIISSVPIWMGLMHWMIEPARRPGPRGIAGLLIGFLGVGILVHPGAHFAGGHMVQIGSLLLVVASAFWAAGSLYSRRAGGPPDPILATSVQMLTGGAANILVGLVTGEAGRLHLDEVTPLAAWSYLYLITFGSIVAFTAYTWLLKVTTPAKAATYAYVNPIVAVVLGSTIADEPISRLTLFAAAIVIGSVILVTTERRADPPPRARAQQPLGNPVAVRDDGRELK
jgi:drug/metabolite transporter (DMT)-like permease